MPQSHAGSAQHAYIMVVSGRLARDKVAHGLCECLGSFVVCQIIVILEVDLATIHKCELHSVKFSDPSSSGFLKFQIHNSRESGNYFHRFQQR
jgi:hypothetical protein